MHSYGDRGVAAETARLCDPGPSTAAADSWTDPALGGLPCDAGIPVSVHASNATHVPTSHPLQCPPTRDGRWGCAWPPSASSWNRSLEGRRTWRAASSAGACTSCRLAPSPCRGAAQRPRSSAPIHAQTLLSRSRIGRGRAGAGPFRDDTPHHAILGVEPRLPVTQRVHLRQAAPLQVARAVWCTRGMRGGEGGEERKRGNAWVTLRGFAPTPPETRP